MGEQDREVDDPDRASPLESDATDLEVIDQVACEEEGRNRDRRDHTSGMTASFSIADQGPAEPEEQGAGGVERRVDRGQSPDPAGCRRVLAAGRG